MRLGRYGHLHRYGYLIIQWNRVTQSTQESDLTGGDYDPASE